MSDTTHTLLLGADYKPLKAITWKRAIEMLVDERATLVAAVPDVFVRSPSTEIPWPSVVALKKFVKPRIRLRYNRPNVLGRDQYVCCYCGSSPKHGNGKPDTSKLTIDHVIPRAQSKNAKVVSCVTGQLIPVTCWGNVVTACKDCNGQKADQTPTQAGMPLRYLPRTPDAWDVLRASLRKVHVPEIWLPYLPDNVR